MARRFSFGAALLVLAAGCGGGEKKDDGPKPAEGGPGPASQPTSEPSGPSKPPVPVAGRWTRGGDGLVFDVKDDGTTVTGKLESDPKGDYEEFAFVLKREGDDLVGSATFKAKGGAGAETKWRLRPDEAGNVVGENEVVAVDPDTGELAAHLGRARERQPFTIVRPEPPKPEAPKPEEPKPEAPKPEEPKPEAPKPEEPKPEAPKPTEEPKKPAVVKLEKPEEAVRAIFDAAKAKDKAALEALLLSNDELVIAVGEANAPKVRKASLDRLEKEMARLEKEHPGLGEATFVEATVPAATKSTRLKQTDFVDGPAIVYETGGEKKTLKLGALAKVADGGWKVLTLLAK